MPPQSTQLPLVLEAAEWRPVVGYEGWYEVSSLGGVRRVRHTRGTWAGRVLTPSPDKWGYPIVGLYRENHRTVFRVHRLVLAAFSEPPVLQDWGHHKNGIKADNRLSNLEWATQTENTRHAVAMGLLVPVPPRLKGEQCPWAKLTEDDVLVIRAARGRVTGKELARQFCVSRSMISLIQAGNRWKHS